MHFRQNIQLLEPKPSRGFWAADHCKRFLVSVVALLTEKLKEHLFGTQSMLTT